MIGTSYEMLLYLSYFPSTWDKLGLHPQRLTRLRNRISFKNYPEDTMTDWLTKLDCKCVRPKIVLPAVVRDRFGKTYDENTFLQLFLTQEIADKWGINRQSVYDTIARGLFVDIATLKHVIRSRRGAIVQQRFTLDSIWSYEPIEVRFTDEKIRQLRKMLGFQDL